MTSTTRTPLEDFTPTWGEVQAGWDPTRDGQGNEGLAAALDRITDERLAAAGLQRQVFRTYETYRIAWDDGAYWSGGWDSREEAAAVLAGCDRAGHCEFQRHTVGFDPAGVLLRIALPGIEETEAAVPAGTKPGEVVQTEWERF